MYLHPTAILDDMISPWDATGILGTVEMCCVDKTSLSSNGVEQQAWPSSISKIKWPREGIVLNRIITLAND